MSSIEQLAADESGSLASLLGGASPDLLSSLGISGSDAKAATAPSAGGIDENLFLQDDQSGFDYALNLKPLSQNLETPTTRIKNIQQALKVKKPANNQLQKLIPQR